VPVTLVPDWVLESGFSDSGFSEAAADAIYASLLRADQASDGKLLSGNLHLIGHSRGTVVNSELAQRILWGADRYGLPRPRDLQMTTLDPHDFEQKSLMLTESTSDLLFNFVMGNHTQFVKALLKEPAARGAGAVLSTDQLSWVPDGLRPWLQNAIANGAVGQLTNLLAPGVNTVLGLADMFQANHKDMGLKQIDFADFYDPNVFAWEGVSYADNYYQAVADENASPGESLTPNGRSLAGAGFDFDFHLKGLKGFTVDDKNLLVGSVGDVHGRPQAWYFGTLNSAAPYLGNLLTGKDEKSKADWVIRRRADANYEEPNTPILTTPSIYGTNELPWYVQRLDKIAGRTFQGEDMLDLIQSRAGNRPLDTWEGIGMGWFQSRLGGGSDTRLSINHRTDLERDNTEWGANGEIVPSVYNGDFQASIRPVFGRFIPAYHLPGWALHNGAEPDGADRSQGRNLALKGIDTARLDALAAEKGWDTDKKDKFIRALSELTNNYGANFTLEKLVGSLKVIEAIRTSGSTLSGGLSDVIGPLLEGWWKGLPPLPLPPVPGFEDPIKWLADQLSKRAATKMVGDLLNLVSGLELNGIGDLGLAISRVADWGIQLGTGSKDLRSITHNWMLLPPGSAKLSFDFINGADTANSDARLEVTFITENGGVETEHSAAALSLANIAVGPNSFSSRIPPSVSGPVKIRFTLTGSAGSVVLDNIRFSGALVITDSTGNDRDGTVFFHDRTSSSNAEFGPATWIRPVQQDGANVQSMGVRNDLDSDVSYTIRALPNEFLLFEQGGNLGPVGSGGPVANGVLAAGASESFRLGATLSASGRQALQDQYDAALLSTNLNVESSQAGTTRLRAVYFAELSDLNGADGTLYAPPVHAGQTRTLRIFNPEGIEVLVQGGHWTAKTGGGVTTLTLQTDKNGGVYTPVGDRLYAESNLVIMLNGREYWRGRVAAQVWPTQRISVDLHAFLTQFNEALQIARKPVESLADANEQQVHAMLPMLRDADVLPLYLDDGQIETLLVAMQRAVGYPTGEGVYASQVQDGLLAIHWSAHADNTTAQVRFSREVFDRDVGNLQSLIGRAAWDFDRNSFTGLLLDGTSVTTASGSRGKEYALSLMVNRKLNDADGYGFGDANYPGPSVSVPRGLREALVLAAPLASLDERLRAIGRYFGWLVAHEFGHNLGLPDEYELDGAGQWKRLVGADTFMSTPSILQGSSDIDALLQLALRRGSEQRAAEPTPQQVDRLIRYLRDLGNGDAFLGAPPVNGPLPAAAGLSSAPVLGGTPRAATQPQAQPAPAFRHGLPVQAALRGDSLSDIGGWSPSGAVVVGAGQARLGESAERHARLAQAFVLQDSDRKLSFTLASNGLVSNGAGPRDAFEVALLDATTGAPLLGAAGRVSLSRSDALLNRQSDGTERLAASVSKLVNADGSSTYFIQLPQGLAGREVLLSFDLLGFGALTSSVTLRDVRFLSAPLATADTLALDEDGTASGDVTANDITVGAAVASVQLIDGPQHGSLDLGADGRYTYRPAADYFGSDGFSYRFTDTEGRVSNVATVQISVRAVNDAPVLSLSAGSRAWVEGQPSVALDPALALADPDGNLARATVAITGGFTPGDVLSVPSSELGGLGTSYNAASGVLTLSGDAPPAVYRHAMRAIAFRSDGDDPTAVGATRTLSWTVNDGVVDSAPRTSTVTITGVNDAPSGADRTVTIAEDTQYTVKVADFGFSDVDAHLFAGVLLGSVSGAGSLMLDGAAAAGQFVGAADIEAGKLVFLPAANANGPNRASFTFQVRDSGGTAAGGTDLDPTPNRLTFDVTPVNDAPTLADRSAEALAGQPLVLDARVGAADVEGDLLTPRLVQGPAHGALVLGADGSFTYVASAGYRGSDQFTYVVSDGQADSRVATVAITVLAASQPPQAADSTVTGVEDEVLVLRWSDFAVASPQGSELTLGVRVLPAAGRLERRLDSGAWVAVQVGDTLGRALVLAGGLRFVPEAHAASGEGAATPGDGNRRPYYGRLRFAALDGALSSAEAELRIDIAARADAPTLQLQPRSVAVSRELLFTNWEGVANANRSATVVAGPQLQGWTLTPPQPGRTAAFEVFANNDLMRNSSGNGVVVSAPGGGGSGWLRLQNGGGAAAYQTLGIERQVETVAGARYTLQLWYAASPGFAQANSTIGIYVDGVQVAVHGASSPLNALNWQSLSFGFDGNGQPRRVTIQLEGGNAAATSPANLRSANLDGLRIVETLPVSAGRVYAIEGQVAALPQLVAALVDSDGSERLALSIEGLPEGAVLGDGVNSRAVSAGGAVDVTGWNLGGLQLQLPAGPIGSRELTVRATSTEAANGSQATSTRSVTLTVLPGPVAVTPLGVNPYVSMTTGTGTSEQPGAAAVQRMPAVRQDDGRAWAQALASGAVAYGPATAWVPRVSSRDEQAERERQRRESEAWMANLENAAQEQWRALVGGREPSERPVYH
jgi:hypothetical protein